MSRAASGVGSGSPGDEERLNAFQAIELHFAPYVFPGSRFPDCAFLGANDHDQSIRQMVEALQACAAKAKLTVYPEVGHDAWTPTYPDPAFYEWLLSHRRTAGRD